MTYPTNYDLITRRAFLRYGGALGALAGMDATLPAWARGREAVATSSPGVLDGREAPIDLVIARTPVRIDGREGRAVTLNGSLPGPTLRFREGGEAVVRVTNRLDEDTSVHWHGILLPNPMDGVPKVTYPGIRPGETFEYRYPVGQYGTYWYHSHTRLQEQLGHYGAYVIDPSEPEPFEYDRDHVVVLSDWTFEDPYRIMARLKKQSDYYNFQKRTVGDFFRDVGERGFFGALGDRLRWGGMRMSPTDISDVTGATYTYLVNGMGPEDNWTGLFEPGERVRLRLINASAASYLDVRIPGLPLEVVQVSGQHVRPVETDEIRIAVAETYDVIVRPGDRAYTLFAEAIDRSGFARGTLAPKVGMEAAIPARRDRPTLTMADMGMAGMEGMAGMGGMGGAEGMAGMDAKAAGADSAMTGGMGREPMSMADTSGTAAAGMHPEPPKAEEPVHEGRAMAGMSGAMGLRPPGTLPEPTVHGPDHHGPANASVAMVSRSRLDEAGMGLGEDGWRVLRYTDLRTATPPNRLRPPDREIEIHLTGDMERFIWSMDGKTFSQAEPIRVRLGERIRLTMVNDTMMNHPMHLHGMFMELENGAGVAIPKVHTVNVKPAERLSLLFTADAPGPWAFHCHILYHMDAGMFRVVEVVEETADADEGEGR